MIQDLRFEGGLRPIAINPEKDKMTRLHARTAKIEAGQVFLPERAAWLRDFQAEMKQFPNGRYDDPRAWRVVCLGPQQFNTTTSMGRLTLNVLLSFAQFEREVISERIRDKIAASPTLQGFLNSCSSMCGKFLQLAHASAGTLIISSGLNVSVIQGGCCETVGPLPGKCRKLRASCRANSR